MNPTTSNPGVLSRAFIVIIKATLLPAIVFVLTTQFAHAGSATWNLNPTSGDWISAANWTPAKSARRSYPAGALEASSYCRFRDARK